MARTTVSSRQLVQPYKLNLSNSSSQRVQIARVAANDLSGLSAATLVLYFIPNGIVAAAGIVNAPTDGTQEVFGIKNFNTGAAQFRINIRVGGVSGNFDISSGAGYKTGVPIVIAVRYDGANVTFWANGNLLQTTAKSGAFGTLTGDWNINSNGAGASPHNTSVIFFRAWNTALDNATMPLAMLAGYRTGAVIDMSFLEGTGSTSLEAANNATVTFVNTPTWSSFESRSVAGARTQIA